MSKKMDKYRVSMYSFSIFPEPKKVLRIAERLSAIKDAAKKRRRAFMLKVIEFHDRYETSATVSAFGISRATIYLWKKKLRRVEGDWRVSFQNRGSQRELDRKVGSRR